MERLYQALGNAKISVSLLISYLKDAEPISIIAEKKHLKQKSIYIF